MLLVERRSQYYKKEIASLQVANEALKAHINSLLASIKEIREVLTNNDSNTPRVDAVYIAKEAINSTPTQSLAEHDRKVIAEFRTKCKAVVYTSQNDLDNVAYQSKMPCEYKSKGDCTVPLYTLPPIDNEEK